MRAAVALGLTAAAALASSAPAAAAAQRVSPPAGDVTPQRLFGDVIREDPRTTTAIRRLLQSGGGFVTARPLFADLTADGKDDAVVPVVTPGVAGAVAAYVLSADGARDGGLRVVYRTQLQYRLRVRVTGATLTLTAPAWRRGDDACCPSRELQRDYAFNRRLRGFQRREERVLDVLPG